MSEKSYFPFSQYLKQRFGQRVHKIAIDAGFTCPNLDGTKSYGGCTYCNQQGFSYNSRREILPISMQIDKGLAFMKKRFRCRKFLAYFQAHTNTFAPLQTLKETYDCILPYQDEIIAMSVSTRPDAVSPATLDLLESYNEHLEEVWVEYGLQSCHNQTLERINRQDTYERFLWAIDETCKRNLKICVHVILGLPGESHSDMMQTAECLANLPIHSLKIHLLHIMKGTVMEEQYRRGKMDVFTLEEYVNHVVDFLERIPPEISIQRLTADAPPNVLVAPDWCLDRKLIYESIDAELIRRESWQGKYCNAVKHSDLTCSSIAL